MPLPFNPFNPGAFLKTTHIAIEDVTAVVTFKNIKTLRLSVHAPDGDVRVSAPRHMRIGAIKAFVATRLDWIRKHQQKQRSRERPPVLRYEDGESHLLWGTPYPLRIVEAQAPAQADVSDGALVLTVRPGHDTDKRAALVWHFYREVVKAALPGLIGAWEPVIGVKVNGFYVRKMTSRWGSCNVNAGTIRLNSELACRAPECLEYVVVHEMVHLLEASHNKRFYALMDRFLPDWQRTRKDLYRVHIG